MNAAYVHLALNHFPLLGIGFGLLLLVAGMVQRSDVLKKAALVTLAVAGLAAGPVYLSGEPAEGVVEDLAGVSERAIESHEESALASLVAAGLLGVVALAAWWVLRRGGVAARLLVNGALALGVVTALLLARTAQYGGRIRHTELRSGATAPAEDHEDEDDERRGHR